MVKKRHNPKARRRRCAIDQMTGRRKCLKVDSLGRTKKMQLQDPNTVRKPPARYTRRDPKTNNPRHERDKAYMSQQYQREQPTDFLSRAEQRKQMSRNDLRKSVKRALMQRGYSAQEAEGYFDSQMIQAVNDPRVTDRLMDLHNQAVAYDDAKAAKRKARVDLAKSYEGKHALRANLMTGVNFASHAADVIPHSHWGKFEERLVREGARAALKHEDFMYNTLDAGAKAYDMAYNNPYTTGAMVSGLSAAAAHSYLGSDNRVSALAAVGAVAAPLLANQYGDSLQSLNPFGWGGGAIPMNRAVWLS